MYNKVFLIGNLARDPELRYTPSGVPVVKFAVAVNRLKKKEEGKEGAGQDVDFINVVGWRRLAEICGEYIKKGDPIALEGTLRVNSFVGRDGQKRTMVEVVMDSMQMLGKKSDRKVSEVAKEAPVEAKEEPVDEIPF